MSDLDLGATIRGYSPGQKVFGRYTLKKILGRGGMGIVWLARDEELERDVALKFLPEILALDRESVAELKRETRRNLELTHPHIVRIYDFVQDGQSAAISMEFVDGASLSALKLDQPGNVFSVARVAKWMRQLGEALGYAHESAQIVHRDLKPANLMINQRGELKITDFGIATSISDSVSRVSMQAGSSGTPLYMSPQQMMGEKPAATDDIYALGATLYELLTGKPPFYTGNIVLQVQNKVAPTMAARRAELGLTEGEAIPEEWESVVAACLAKDAAERPQSMRDVLERLKLGVARPSVGAATTPRSAPEAPRKTAESAPAPVAAKSTAKPKSTAAILAGVFVAVVLAGVGYYYGWVVPERRQQEEARLRQVELDRIARENLAAEEAAKAAALAAAAEAKRQAEAEAAAALLREQQQAAKAKIEETLEGLTPQIDAGRRDEIGAKVKAYLADAPDTHRAEIERVWSMKLDAWVAAHRPASLLVRTDPDDAEIHLDGVVRRSPTLIDEIPPGRFRFTVVKPGYQNREVEFDLAAGQVLEPAPIELSPVLHAIDVSATTAGVTYRLLDRTGADAAGRLPATLHLPAGIHRVEYSREGYGQKEDVLVVPAGSQSNPVADLRGSSVEISTAPEGAQVTINGRAFGAAPIKLEDVAPGEVEIAVSAADHDPVVIRRQTKLGDKLQEHVAMRENARAVFLKNLQGYWAAGLGGFYFEDTSGRGIYRAGSNFGLSENIPIMLDTFDEEEQRAVFSTSNPKRLPRLEIRLKGTVPYIVLRNTNGKVTSEWPYTAVTQKYWEKL